MYGGRGMDEMTLGTLLLVGGKSGVPVSSLSRFQFISTCCLLWVKALLGRPRGKVPGEGRVSLPLFQAGKADKSGQWTREGASSREGGRSWRNWPRAGGLGRFPLIPLISGGQACLFGQWGLLLQHFLEPPKVNTTKSVFLQLYCVCSFQQKGQAGQPSEVTPTHQNVDNKDARYSALAPRLRDNCDGHKVLNHHHNHHHQLNN